MVEIMASRNYPAITSRDKFTSPDILPKISTQNYLLVTLRSRSKKFYSLILRDGVMASSF
jgi:hypothetical protein